MSVVIAEKVDVKVIDLEAAKKAIQSRETEVLSLIQAHREVYEQWERSAFIKARQYYRGEFWSGADTTHSDLRRSSMLTGDNVIFAIVDTALTAMLGANPRVACNPRNGPAEQARFVVNGLMDWIFEHNAIRQTSQLTLMDAILCKRGIFKTTWSCENDAPQVTSVDPSRLFFDPVAREPKKIQYWIEATVITEGEYGKRVASGMYRHPRLHEVKAGKYPSWVGESGGDGTGLSTGGPDWKDRLRNARRWVTVYEHYDRAAQRVEHIIEGIGIVFSAPLPYIPYSMFSLNHTGTDCFGLSEVQLVLNQQEAINDLLTLMKSIVYRLIPRMMYDASAISPDEIGEMLSGEPGDFVAVRPANSAARRNLGAFFEQMPMPENFSAVPEFIDRMKEIMAQTTALAEMSRGQVTGARTATEIALVDAQMRTRLSTRDGHFGAALEDVAKKCLFLCQRHMTTAKTIQITGSPAWASVSFEDLREVDVSFNLVAYSPLKNNPAVQAETLINLYPQLAQSPTVKVEALDRALIKALGLPEEIVKTPAEIAAEMEAAMQAEAGAAGALGAPGGGGGMGALPPDAADPAMAALMAQEEGTVPAPEGAIPAPGGQTVVQDMELDEETLNAIFSA